MDRPRKSVQITRAAGPVQSGTDGGGAGVISGRRGGSAASRALLGGLLVAAAAVIVFATALSAAGGTQAGYVVAARPLPAGTVIGPGDTETARLGLRGATAAASFRQAGPVIGRTLQVPVQPGQLIESSMLGGTPGAGLRPVSIPVDTDSLAALDPGQLVDVLSTPSASAGTGAVAAPPVTLVMRGATLLSVGRSDSGLLSGGTGGTVVVTVGVSDLGEAEQLVQAAHAGTVELVRAEPSDGSGPGSGNPSAGG